MKQRIHQIVTSSLTSFSLAAGQNMPRFALVLLVLLMAYLGQAPATWGATYHGQVVDAETGKPIEGAVVMVEWHKKPRIAMGGISYFHDARETLTDTQGNFSLDASEGINWNPFTVVQEPRITVFYPGYRPLSPEYPGEFKDVYGIAEALERGVVVKLPKLTTKDELRTTSLGLILAPWRYVPNLMKLINVQRKMAGLSEYKEPTDREGAKP